MAINTRCACLAALSQANSEGAVCFDGPKIYEDLSAKFGLSSKELMGGLEDAQNKQWLAPFAMNEEMQAITQLTIPEGLA